MAKYKVRYYECYEGYYEVEANSKEEAEEKLINDISEGKENTPEECYDSGASVELIEDASFDVSNTFITDMEKMADFKVLTKEEFLRSYSYLTEDEYDATALYLDWLNVDDSEP